MDRREIEELITTSIKSCRDSITTDWLSYCLDQSVEIELLEEKVITEVRSIKGGIPAVNTYRVIDNDFFNCQDETFQKDFEILNRSEFSVCIEKIQDIQILDSQNVNVIKNQVFLSFKDPPQ